MPYFDYLKMMLLLDLIYDAQSVSSGVRVFVPFTETALVNFISLYFAYIYFIFAIHVPMIMSPGIATRFINL